MTDRWCLLAVLLLLWSILGCHSDREVEQLVTRFQEYRVQFPEAREDLVPALAELDQRLDSLEILHQQLLKVDTHTVSTAGKAERQLLLRTFEQEWAFWVPYRTDPSLYNIGGLLKKELVLNGADRIERLTTLCDQAEVYYRQAKEHLRVSDVSLYRLAAQKQYLTLTFLQEELPDSLRQWKLSAAESSGLDEKMDTVRLVVKDYLAFCESQFLNERDRIYQGERPAR